MLKQKYFLADIFILSAEKQPIKLSWRKIEWLRKDKVTMDFAFFAIAFNIKKMCAKIKNQKMTDKNYKNIRVA